MQQKGGATGLASRQQQVCLVLRASSVAVRLQCGPVCSDPAPKTSVYALYRLADASNQPTRTLCAQVKVYEGCPLGFDRGPDDRPRAVAGSESYVLAEEGWYRWEETSGRLADHKLTDLRWSYGESVRSGLESTGQVIAFPFMVAGAAAVTTFALLFGLPGGA